MSTLKVRKNCKHLAKGGLKSIFRHDEHESLRIVNDVVIYRDPGTGFIITKTPDLVFVHLDEAVDFVEERTS